MEAAPYSSNDDAACPRAHFADVERFLAGGAQYADGPVRIAGRHVHGHADAAVEHAVHLRIGDLAFALQPVEHHFAAPGTALQYHFQTVRQHARNVIDKSAAGDMRQPVHGDFADQLQQDGRRAGTDDRAEPAGDAGSDGSAVRDAAGSAAGRILGQPDVAAQKIDNPIVIPKMLSFLTWRSWGAEVKA